MTPEERLQQKVEHIRQQMRERMEIEYLEDGCARYSPKIGFGLLSAEDLRIIAEYLDELNEPWLTQIEEDMRMMRNIENDTE